MNKLTCILCCRPPTTALMSALFPDHNQAITAGVLSGISDLLAQRLASSGPVNLRRTLAVALWGLLWSGPTSHFWQQALERLFPNKRDPMRT